MENIEQGNDNVNPVGYGAEGISLQATGRDTQAYARKMSLARLTADTLLDGYKTPWMGPQKTSENAFLVLLFDENEGLIVCQGNEMKTIFRNGKLLPGA